MSGHSKWATIHRQKEVKDARRGALFTKLAQAIMVAVRQGGGVADPDQNFKLRLAVDKARQFNMPKENITRAIERAAGAGGEQLREYLFEGFLPGGVAVLTTALSDNHLRTSAAIRAVLEKAGGSLGSTNSVAYLFAPLGEVVVKMQDPRHKTQDEQELELIDAGVEDISREEDRFILHCDPKSTFAVRDTVEKLGYTVESAELIMHPTALVQIAPEIQTKIEAILAKLEELDDVQRVYTNYA